MTAQTPERLLYLGEDVAMCSEPLEDYFAAGAARPKFDGLCSALWRGYVGSWEINHDLLYLVGIDTTAVGGTKDCLAAVFPNCDGRVFAEWYSGTIRIPQGELLEYVHGGYESTYEIDVLLHIERGVVVATEKHRNGTSDATRLVEDGNQDPARNAPALRLSEPHTSYNREEFTDSLLQALVGEGLDVWVKPDFWPTDGGEYSFSSLDGARYADQWLLQNLYLKIENENYVAIRFLLDTLRQTELPLRASDGWAVWDDEAEVLRCCWPRSSPRLAGPIPRGDYTSWRHDDPPAVRSPFRQYRRASASAELLRSWWLSTDHGKKPVLIRRIYEQFALKGKAVSFLLPREIQEAEYGDLVLARYGSSGAIECLGLDSFAIEDLPIVTRNCVYFPTEHALKPSFTRADFLANAFEMAVRHHPGHFSAYVARAQGTVFESAIERLALDEVLEESGFNAHTFDFSTLGAGGEALVVAAAITNSAQRARAELGDEVYLSVGAHPIEAGLVTTPELYEHAIKTLFNFGYSIAFKYGGRVEVVQKSCA